MPAHITLLFPFKHVSEINDDVRERLRQLFAKHASFDFSLAGVCGFPDVLYLAPEPREPFDALSRAIYDHFPETPPYAGTINDPVPHLTFALWPAIQELADIAEKFLRGAQLPITARATSVFLMESRGDPWREHACFPLSG